MYVDESGDTGLVNSPTRYFVLSGIVVHESRWRDFLNVLIAFRRTLKSAYGLPVRAEIHSAPMISHSYYGLARFVRLAILRNCLDELAKIPYISIINIVVDKATKPPNYDVFGRAWITLFQRFENTLLSGNFPGNARDDFGIVITDATAGKQLSLLVRRMAVVNYIPHLPWWGTGSRNVPIARLIEDPYGKNSANTLPVQMADVVAYCLHQRFAPNAYFRKQKAQFYFNRAKPVLNLLASRADPLGVVKI